ncbi:hypothetical protein [Olivibacter jilunii]|uniref:hypothetical protein n=1 Tax=Olivibacter jilunii TaxID=985016 RepID=UPI001030A31B|nr:hypothetical protein [Olivibacter jilunii]
MEKILIEKLWDYIVTNNPELMYNLQEDYKVQKYLQERVQGILPLADALEKAGEQAYTIEEICLDALTEELRPSRYHYIIGILKEDFEDFFEDMTASGILTFEVLNMMEACEPVFELLNFSVEREQDRMIRYAIIGQLHEYLQGRVAAAVN